MNESDTRDDGERLRVIDMLRALVRLIGDDGRFPDDEPLWVHVHEPSTNGEYCLRCGGRFVARKELLGTVLRNGETITISWSFSRSPASEKDGAGGRGLSDGSE